MDALQAGRGTALYLSSALFCLLHSLSLYIDWLCAESLQRWLESAPHEEVELVEGLHATQLTFILACS